MSAVRELATATGIGSPLDLLPSGLTTTVAGRVCRRSAALARAIFSSLGEARAIDRSDRTAEQALTAKAYALARASASICRSHGVRISASGPIPSGPAVLVANHVSYLDPLAITSLVPCLPIAKREVGSWPLLGGAIRQLGVSLVERGNPMSGAMSLRRVLRLLRSGVSVLNFPEGTTTDGDEVLPFHRGIFGVARLAGVPVIPVAIRFEDRRLAWTGDESFLPHYLRTIRRLDHRAHVRFGPPLTPLRYSKAGDLATEAGVIVAHMLWER